MLIGGLTKLEMNIGKMTINCILAQRISKIVKVLFVVYGQWNDSKQTYKFVCLQPLFQ